LGAECLTGPAWQGDYSAAGGVEIVRGLIDLGATLPRAIACANDQTALGVIYALAEHGLDVPRDVAVTGFDDLPFARHLRPQLTTVRQPIQEIGAQAFEVLHSMITASNGAAASPRRATPPTTAAPPTEAAPPDASPSATETTESTGTTGSTRTTDVTDIVLPTRLIRRESCGCPPDPTTTPAWRRIT
jgi:LacI family transcriptional regulator